MKQLNAQRKAAIAAAAFLIYAVGAMCYSSQLPGQTRAQAAEAHQAVVTQCATAKAAGAGVVDRTAACLPAPMRRVDSWLTFGLLALGAVMLGTGVAANRSEE